MADMSPNATFITDMLNENGRDDYLASLFLPADKRLDVQTLWAFAAELSLVRQRVSEPMPGEIRLQWWHDVLEGKRDSEAHANPLAAGLLDVIARYNLPKIPLLRWVAAHRFDLYDDPMPDRNQFEGYAGETRAVRYQYAAMAVSKNTAEISQICADAAGHLGVATAYMERILGFQRDCANAQIYLPLSIFESFGLTDHDVLAGAGGEKLRAAMNAHMEAMTDHLAKAKKAIKDLPPEVRPAFVRCAFLAKTADKMQKAGEGDYLSPNLLADWQKLWFGFWFLA